MPKITGTHKQAKEALYKKLHPSGFSCTGMVMRLPREQRELFMEQYKLWFESWIEEDLKKYLK